MKPCGAQYHGLTCTLKKGHAHEKGLATHLDRGWMVRFFAHEVEYPTWCAVSHCAVSLELAFQGVCLEPGGFHGHVERREHAASIERMKKDGVLK